MPKLFQAPAASQMGRQRRVAAASVDQELAAVPGLLTIDELLIGCLYPANGNPAPGPKFDDKLTWFGRLAKDALFLPESRAAYQELLAQGWTDALRTQCPEGLAPR